MILVISSSLIVGLLLGLIIPTSQKLAEKKSAKANKKAKNLGWLESASYIIGKYED